jgi:hypothetical protein
VTLTPSGTIRAVIFLSPHEQQQVKKVLAVTREINGT